MKNDKNILDNYLQNKVEEAEFVMQEAHWLKALAAIEDGEQAPKKPWPWLRTLLIAGLLLLAGATYKWMSDNTKNDSNTIVNNTSNKKNDSIANNTANTDKVIKAIPDNKTINSNENNTASYTNEPTNQIESKPKSINKTPSKARIVLQKIANMVQPNKAIATPENDSIAKQEAKIIAQLKAEKQQQYQQAIQANRLEKQAKLDAAKIAKAEAKLLAINQKQALQQLKMAETKAKEMAKQTAKQLKKAEAIKAKEIAKQIAAEKREIASIKKQIQMAEKQAILDAKNIAKENAAALALQNALALEMQKAEAKKEKLALKKAKQEAKQLAKIKAKEEKQIVHKAAEPKPQIAEPKPENNVVKSKKVASEIPVAKSNPRYIDAKYLKMKPRKTEEADRSDWTTVTSVQTIAAPKKVILDSAVATTSVAEPKTKIAFQKSTKSITANTQIGYGASPKNTNGQTAWNASPYFGIGYWLPLHRRMDLHTQLGATYISNLPYSYTATNYTYGFGVDSTTFNLQQKTLYQLCIPATFSYKISLKQCLLMGFGANIGLDVLSNVKKFNATASANTWGFENGFTRVAPFATLGYQYHILKGFYVQALIQQGFTDITNNTFFNNTNTDRNTKASIGLTYKLK